MDAMHTIGTEALNFIDLNLLTILFLFGLGFIGGLVSGFIGSGGAFVLTPGMMSLGVPATVAVATNMCHKFPKALVGAIKRHKYGQVDIKMGLILGVSAEVGVQLGIQIQTWILGRWGQAGSNLYVSLAFLSVLLVVGSLVMRDAIKSARDESNAANSGLVRRLQAIELWPMIHFKTANIRISLWITVPIGLATGVLAATIAVGGFIGVPGMMYLIGVASIMATATELVIAFVMGLGGTLIWAYYGMVDIRLVLIILGGSLLGVQLGAIGTTYVKEYMIKVVMGVIMLIVALSRGIALPTYLHQLDLMSLSDGWVKVLNGVSFVLMCLALLVGALIILGSMFKARRAMMAQAMAIPEPEMAQG
jgi:uncharacterized membrane protein YfcA